MTPLLAFFRRAAALLVLGLGIAHAADYRELTDPVPVQAPPGKIEVTEIFWYGCPHCYEFEPSFEAWVKKLPDDVAVERLPAAFNNTWERHARIYYIAESLGLLSKTHQATFDAIHQQGKRLNDADSVAEFFSQFGADPEKVKSLYNSFGVNAQLKQDMSRLRGYQVTGVPALVVDGRYVIDGRTAGSLQNMLSVANKLIEQVRQDHQ